MKKNYQAWHLKVSDFPEKGILRDQLIFLLRFAILAPSGHNSQPWNFIIENNVVDISVNEERSLSQSDPNRRQLLVSIGCALENFLIAAEHFGFSSEIRHFPQQENQNIVARVFLEKDRKEKKEPADLIHAILERRTNRNKYRERLPSQDFLSGIQKLSNKDVIVSVVVDKTTKASVADVVNAAQIEVMEEASFREELSHYIKSNLTKSKTGMPGFTLGMPLPISLIASRLIKRVNMSKKTMKKDDELLKLYTPVFVLVGTASDDNVSRVKAGQIFERIWLMATKEGLSCAPLAAGVQVGEYYKDLQKILGLSSRPQAFLRMGYCGKSVRHSPRFYVEEVLKVN